MNIVVIGLVPWALHRVHHETGGTDHKGRIRNAGILGGASKTGATFHKVSLGGLCGFLGAPQDLGDAGIYLHLDTGQRMRGVEWLRRIILDGAVVVSMVADDALGVIACLKLRRRLRLLLLVRWCLWICYWPGSGGYCCGCGCRRG